MIQMDCDALILAATHATGRFLRSSRSLGAELSNLPRLQPVNPGARIGKNQTLN